MYMIHIKELEENILIFLDKRINISKFYALKYLIIIGFKIANLLFEIKYCFRIFIFLLILYVLNKKIHRII